MERRKLPRLAYNWISITGALLAAFTAFLTAIFMLISFIAGVNNPYLGIFLYMMLPPVFIFGLVMIPFGMWRQWRRTVRGEVSETLQWPFIDFNKSSHRNAFIVFVVGTSIFVSGGAVIGYQAYHFTESVTFCGTTCHAIMEPEYTAYQNSPHARVPCTECHVGSGAGWYTKSKLSGLYQVYATMRHIYPTPIPTPVENLRPAQQTCEQCHWPKHFFGAQQKQFDHYKYDSMNTHWPISLLIKTGGGDPQAGHTAGIHWHMNIGFKVEYIARDKRRQVIPWMKITDKQTGKSTIYQDESNPLTAEEIAKAEPRTMDCVDCHNRPSHIYRAPDYAIDAAILTNQIPASLPDIKKVAVESMAAEYGTKDSAMAAINRTIMDYYRNSYPDSLEAYKDRIASAVTGTQRAYANNIFPLMKVRWSEYPINIGHFTSPGCMRCHDGNHKSDEGVAVTRDCNSCHTILAQGSGERAQVTSTEAGLPFEHPEDIGDAWKESGCYECHTGVQP